MTQTVVPVRKAQPDGGWLVARSQAKRLLKHAEKFQVVLLDFQKVESIGPEFADEIFQVFALQHPEIELVPVNANLEVEKMITRARNHMNAP